MKATPIIMSAPMIRALLSGSKTQTRRIIKPQPQHIEWFDHQKEWNARVAENRYRLQPCPFGKPGDVLWVRETCAFQWPEHCDDGRVYEDDLEYGRPIRRDECDVLYRATDNGE